MEELKQWLNKYGSTLSSANIAEIRGVDIRTLNKMLKDEPNFPKMKGTKILKIDTTNYYFWTLADYDYFKYEQYKSKFVDALVKENK